MVAYMVIHLQKRSKFLGNILWAIKYHDIRVKVFFWLPGRWRLITETLERGTRNLVQKQSHTYLYFTVTHQSPASRRCKSLWLHPANLRRQVFKTWNKIRTVNSRRRNLCNNRECFMNRASNSLCFYRARWDVTSYLHQFPSVCP